MMNFLKVMITLIVTFNTFINSSFAIDWKKPDWSSEAKIKRGEHRGNIYRLSDDELEEVVKKGYVHTLKWPIEITGLLVPYKPLKYFLEEDKRNPLRRFIERVAERQLGYRTMDEMYEWLGLNLYPERDVPRIFRIPYPENIYPDYRMGASLIKVNDVKGMTFSCATCHSGTFLGRSVMGLTNKRSRANEYFLEAKKYIPIVPAGFFRVATNATKAEKKMFQRTKDNLRFINTVKPQVLGLDTSSAHVALSLSTRRDDEYATKDPRVARRPRAHRLEHFVVDSKPMPWWNLKYKTRWLSDGSIISGNPILMNILWNELGRGTDLKDLEKWIENNDETVKELTAAIFANESPSWTDFFPNRTINIESAKKGERVFKRSCQKCHGAYVKGWSLENYKKLSLKEQIKTIKVFYHEKTPIRNVGTDPQRYQGTTELADSLNKMKISKMMGIKMNLEKGYVPPPLVGVFLRYPYMHNNSIPNLCALMERPDLRPMKWVQGPSQKESDYDQECLGYPVGNKIPKEWWREKDAIYDAKKAGLRNTGHSRMFWNKDGTAKMTSEQKKNLREFLKTL